VSSELRFEGGGVSAPLTIRESARARVMRLKVDQRTGTVLLTLPRRASRKKALEWAAGQRGWIEAALASVKPRTDLAPGAELPLHGMPHRIDWSPERTRTVRVEEGRIVTGGPLDTLEPRLLRWLKREAAELLAAETAEFAEKAGVIVSRVAVGDPVSRWGSCSSSGAIRYSWRLILAPDWVRRATFWSSGCSGPIPSRRGYGCGVTGSRSTGSGAGERCRRRSIGGGKRREAFGSRGAGGGSRRIARSSQS